MQIERDDDVQNPYAASQVESAVVVEEVESRGPEGIGGWLLLPLLGLIFTPIAALVTIVRDNLPPFTEGYFSTLTNPAFEHYHPLWSVVLVFEPIGTATIGAMAVWALVLLTRKDKAFPRFMIAFYSMNLAFVIVDAVLCFQIPLLANESGPALVRDFMRTCIVAAIWIPYMCVSKRVRNTFVN
jgi:hypothetical protein